ncbi:uncharacterized protein [Diadema antillarum]|uniref:uncharacterized protein n=1 Tax=Diadema antillarum TaxID=105358 RepID=UPI003A84A5B2
MLTPAINSPNAAQRNQAGTGVLATVLVSELEMALQQSKSPCTLYLSENNLTTIPHGIFNEQDFHKLEALHLDDNFIWNATEISRNQYTGQSDAIYDAKLQIARPFRGLNSTTELHLENNVITSLQNWTFCEMTSLESLYMAYNLLTDSLMEGYVFGCLPVLEYMRLEHNEIFILERGTFTDITTLETLRLENCEIETIEEHTFPQSIVQIYVFANDMPRLEKDHLRDTKIHYLEMGYADTLTIEEGAFSYQSSISYLYLYWNRITELPMGGTFHNNRVYYLTFNLEGNKIVLIDSYAFIDSSIDKLDFKDVQIGHIDDMAFNDVNFESLQLTGAPLDCTCSVYNALIPVTSSVQDGVCTSPEYVRDFDFVSASSSVANNSTNSSTSVSEFLCTPEVLHVTTPADRQIVVTWDIPSEAYPGAVDQPSEFHVLCTSDSATDLEATISNSISHVFNETDGVEDDTVYHCSVATKFGGRDSGRGLVVPVTTPRIQEDSEISRAVPSTLNMDDFGFYGQDALVSVTHYDFSNAANDFSSLSISDTKSPSYVIDAFEGAWLRMTESPDDETITSWFRSHVTNKVLKSTLVVPWIATDSLHRFTTALRTSFHYTGAELIRVGGGDELWLFIDRRLVLQIINDDANVVKCAEISLVDADDGGAINVKKGTIANERCLPSLQEPNETVDATLKVGYAYRFDLFMTERSYCSSEFFFEFKYVDFPTTDEPEIDYTFHVNEWADIGMTVGNITITEFFDDNQTYLGEVFRSDSDTERPELAVRPSNESWPEFNPLSLPFLDDTWMDSVDDQLFLSCVPQYICEDAVCQNGGTCYSNGPSYFCLCGGTWTGQNCSEDSSDLNEVTTIASGTAVLVTNTHFDRENASFFLVKVRIMMSSNQSNYVDLFVEVHVDDANDNCPEFSDEGAIPLYPIPPFQSYVGNVSATDNQDIGVNSELTYYAEPGDATRIPDSYMYVVAIRIAAIDAGAPPRGTILIVNMTFSETCVYDAEGERTPLHITMDENGGSYGIEVPKYYMYSYDCRHPLGMQSHMISFDRVTSSDEGIEGHDPDVARLHLRPYGRYGSGWIPSVSDTNQWIQATMLDNTLFRGIQTQGSSDVEAWVESFKLQYSNDTIVWTSVTTFDNGSQVFSGNVDQISTVSHSFPDAYGLVFRIIPLTWHLRIGLRFELIGCSNARMFKHQVDCVRCETTYYCSGNGSRYTCGRCDPPSDQCDRSPVEHSYGHASECSPCPEGHICHDGYAWLCPPYTYAVCNETHCSKDCFDCPSGSACFDGVKTDCQPGFYSVGYGQDECLPCQDGSYQPLSRQTSCQCCPPGFYSTEGKTKCAPCKVNQFSDSECGTCQTCTSADDCPCLQQPGPCIEDVRCINVGSGMHRCLDCPPGYNGTEGNCTDIDECAVDNPCWEPAECLNLVPGYVCGRCPAGYEGEVTHGYGLEHTRNHRQGGHLCGSCLHGYVGTNEEGCFLPVDHCAENSSECDPNAICTYTGPGTYYCECDADMGWAGDGYVCGRDEDLDGQVDTRLACRQPNDTRCVPDNCPGYPNSGQEDADDDKVGNSCDPDADNDFIKNDEDNCPLVPNYNQADSDGDQVGDACDNCPGTSNAKQNNDDDDASGNACDSDDDNDGISDGSDNCQKKPNPDQTDTDGDGVGDACDNCPLEANNGQTDSNKNGYGNACDDDSNVDEDGDGSFDHDDNCPSVQNGDQTDTDDDGIGDECDDDMDGDGIPDEDDNCPLVANADQEDTNQNWIGDVCEEDTDGDGYPDPFDNCPRSKQYHTASFIDGYSSNLKANAYTPTWYFKHAGREVTGPFNAEPSSLVSRDNLGDMVFTGTMYVDQSPESGQDNSIGIVFGYQSNGDFYLVQWWRDYRLLSWSPYSRHIHSLKGVMIKRVQAPNAGDTMYYALYRHDNHGGYTKVLWHDRPSTTWEYRTSYRWRLTFRPSIGMFRLYIYSSNGLIVDSGEVFDIAFQGGKVGLFQLDQHNIIWSNLNYQCLESINDAIVFGDEGGYVILGDVTKLKVDIHLTMIAWCFIDGSDPSQIFPIFGTSDGFFNLYVQNHTLIGRYGDVTAEMSGVTYNEWIYVAVSCQPGVDLRVYLDGVRQSTSLQMIQGWDSNTKMYLGRDSSERFFQGKFDEVALYHTALFPSDIEAGMKQAGLSFHHENKIITAHFTMDEHERGSSILKDRSSFQNDALIVGNITFAKNSPFNTARFGRAHPNNKRRRKKRSVLNNDVHFEHTEL